MIDVTQEIEIALRNGGYESSRTKVGDRVVVSFEDSVVLGFAHFFETTDELWELWREAERSVLNRYSTQFRSAGDKAWNTYTVLLAREDTSTMSFERVARIEEDMRETRKIVHTPVQSSEDVRIAILPLLPLLNQPKLKATDFAEQIRAQPSGLSAVTLEAFLGSASSETIATLLKEDQG